MGKRSVILNFIISVENIHYQILIDFDLDSKLGVQNSFKYAEKQNLFQPNLT
jgi:hypothetical protein